MSNKFLSFSNVSESVSSSVINIESNKFYEEIVGDVSIVDLPSTTEYDLLHYYKNAVTESDISFRYKGIEIIKAYKHLIQNLQFYHINGTWVL